MELLKAKQDKGQLSKELKDTKHKSEMLLRTYEECKTRIDELLMEQLRNRQEVTRLKKQLDAVNAENVSLYVCVCVCVCACTCLCIHIHLYVTTYTHTYVCMCFTQMSIACIFVCDSNQV